MPGSFLKTALKFTFLMLLCGSISAHTNILIYSGPGVGPKSLANTVTMIKQLTGSNYTILTVGPETIIDQAWINNTALLIMPGGADKPYLEKLAGQGNANIRNYVNNGGKFLGICAGAYYSADRIEFAKGDKDLEVVGDRELKFFPGLITGPTYAGFDYRGTNANNGARAAKLYWQDTKSLNITDKFTVFYNGGGSFIAADKYSNVTVLALYGIELRNTLKAEAAIVECVVGKGKAILTGVHFEWDPCTLDTSYKQLLDMQPILIEENSNRLGLAKHLLERLDIALASNR